MWQCYRRQNFKYFWKIWRKYIGVNGLWQILGVRPAFPPQHCKQQRGVTTRDCNNVYRRHSFFDIANCTSICLNPKCIFVFFIVNALVKCITVCILYLCHIYCTCINVTTVLQLWARLLTVGLHLQFYTTQPTHIVLWCYCVILLQCNSGPM